MAKRVGARPSPWGKMDQSRVGSAAWRRLHTMADVVVGLLQSPDKAREMGAEGRAWVAKVFDFSRSMSRSSVASRPLRVRADDEPVKAYDRGRMENGRRK